MSINAANLKSVGSVADLSISAPAQTQTEVANKPDSSAKIIAVKPDQGETKDKSSDQELTNQDIKEAVKSLNKYMNDLQTNLSFDIKDDTDQVVVLITNRETKEVIRQFPPEELLKLQERMREVTGLIFDKTV